MLAIIVSTVGKQSETYIETHIKRLHPGRTVVCSLFPYEQPAWLAPHPEMQLYRSTNTALQWIRRLATPNVIAKIDKARLATWLISNHVKAVLCEYLQVAILVEPICARIGIPVIAHAHGYDVTAQPRQEGWAEAYAKCLPKLAAVIVVSESMKASVVAFGVDPNRVHVVPCGTEVRPAPARVHTHKECYNVMAVGRLIGKKGPIYLLEAFRHVVESGTRAKLIVVGEGPFREPMQQFVEATGISAQTLILGERTNSEVRAFLTSADVFVQHSVTAANGDEEGLPVSILEAMSESVPIVATEHAAIGQAVVNGVSGFLVRPGDSRGMAAQITHLLGDHSLRTRMGAAARRRVESEFNVESELLTMRSVIDHCISGGVVNTM